MKKLHLTQSEICDYGSVSELRMLVYYAKEMLENFDGFPEELWEVNDKLLEALIEAHSEYINYMRKIDQM